MPRACQLGKDSGDVISLEPLSWGNGSSGTGSLKSFNCDVYIVESGGGAEILKVSPYGIVADFENVVCLPLSVGEDGPRWKAIGSWKGSHSGAGLFVEVVNGGLGPVSSHPYLLDMPELAVTDFSGGVPSIEEGGVFVGQINEDPELLVERDLVLIRSCCLNALIASEDISTFVRISSSEPSRTDVHSRLHLSIP
jgi:hypothetical protein